jgi:hypothetical protein
VELDRALKEAKPQPPVRSFPSLADELEHLRGEGMTVLAEVGPTSGGGTPGAETRDRQARPDVLAEDKEMVVRWTRETGLVVERKLPEFTLFFYGDDDQPIPLEPDTTREQLTACLDARLTNLDQIIRAVRARRSIRLQDLGWEPGTMWRGRRGRDRGEVSGAGG